MSLSYLPRLALTTLVAGCLMPIFALSSVSLTDGSVVRGTIVTESSDFVVLNDGGADRTIPRSAILEIRRDDGSVSSGSTESLSTGGDLPAPATSVDAAPMQQSTAAPVVSSAARLGRQTREHVSVGVDVYWSMQSRFSNENVNNTGDIRSTNYLTLKPYVGIRMSDIFELRPALLLARTSNSTEYTVEEGLNYSPTSGTIKSIDTSSTRLGFDFGFIFYPIRGNFFRFTIGPALGFDAGLAPTSKRTYFGTTPAVEADFDSYVDFNIPIRFPVGFDFIASNNLGFRLSSEVYRFNVNVRYTKGGTISTTDNSVVTVTSALNLSKVLTDFGIGMFLLF